MKMELLICDIDDHKKDCEFTVWYTLVGEVKPETIVSIAFREMLSLLNYVYIKGHLNKSVCCKIDDEIAPVKYAKTNMTVQEVYDKVREEK